MAGPVKFGGATGGFSAASKRQTVARVVSYRHKKGNTSGRSGKSKVSSKKGGGS